MSLYSLFSASLYNSIYYSAVSLLLIFPNKMSPFEVVFLRTLKKGSNLAVTISHCLPMLHLWIPLQTASSPMQCRRVLSSLGMLHHIDWR